MLFLLFQPFICLSFLSIGFFLFGWKTKIVSTYIFTLIYWSRDKGEVLAEALKIMLCDDRQHDMQRAAAFIKRLATFSLCFGAAESMAGILQLTHSSVHYYRSNSFLWYAKLWKNIAALVTLKHLLQKNVKCRNLLENDAGGGSVSGPVAVRHTFLFRRLIFAVHFCVTIPGFLLTVT